MIPSKEKCKCGHKGNVHCEDADGGGCCVIYRGKDELLKSCYCIKFETPVTGDVKV